MTTKRSLHLCLTCFAFVVTIGAPAVGELPEDLPRVTVTTYDPARVGEGYVFLAVASETLGIGTYVMVLDNAGAPVWYRKIDAPEVYDFKVQPSGLLSYAPFIEGHSYTGGGDVTHEILADNYALREVITGGNGYVAEGHDFQLLPNGHVLQFGYYMSEVDMSQIVAGGHPAALVSGGVVQELDAQRSVVWQWRTWDHYSFADELSSTSAVISAFHLNTINQDPDGNIILGTPVEVRKINRQTGDVMWVLGGSDNEFTAIGEGADVSHFGGHATYRLENGNFLMYDNGPRRGTGTSKVHEYTLDEVNKTATHVWSWAPPTNIKAWHRGNAQRLPNGNTFIGWGGASGDHIPACTEVAPDGEVVFELFFDPASPQVESYRAFRFPYPPETKTVEHSEYEVAQGNEYGFGVTGVELDVQSLSGDGYNEVTVRRAPYAPVYPVFGAKAPRLLPMRVAVSQYSIQTMTAQISFDAASFGFADPASLTVYFRETVGSGLFVPLPTSYNPVIGKLRATLTRFGEFAFGFPDVADIPYRPMLNAVENYRGVQEQMVIAPKLAESGTVYRVNQEREILLSWSPKGFARWFELEIATEETFASPVVDVGYQTDGFKIWHGAAPGTTYLYRVKTWNEGGESDWSVGAFQTVPPEVRVTVPNEGDLWARGYSYFIQWEDNLAEDVVIDLYRAGAKVKTIGTVPGTGAHKWEVGMTLELGSDYTIKISSANDAAVSDECDVPFTIYETPQITLFVANPDGSLSLGWNGAGVAMMIDFKTALPDGEWQAIGGPITEDHWTFFPPPGEGSGFYRLRVQ